jgi:type I restriction enzyme S subunit
MLLRAKRDAIASRANGSTFLEVNKSNFKRVAFDVPPPAARRTFDALAEPVFELIEHLDREARSLSQLRDALAPALVTGYLLLRADD